MISTVAGVLCICALAACASPIVKATTVEAGTAPSWFRGAWKREWSKEKDEAATETRIVRDLQTPTIFGSVRIGLDRPPLPNATSFDDLDDAQLAALLDQKGFAGTASFKGEVAVWEREIDFRPPNSADTARLKPLSPTTVLEEGFDGSSELWWSMSSGDGKYLGIKITGNKRTEVILTVVGDHFVYARNRRRDLPRAESLAALAVNATRAQLIELLDCELSYGTIRSGRVPWEVHFSTLPWREGKPLEFARSITVDASGNPSPRVPTPGWTVAIDTFEAQDLRLLFPP
jgi:hypothetical protein